MMEEYIIEYENYEDLSVAEFIEKIKNTKGKPLNDLKIKDLSFDGNNHLEGGHGVYFFKQNQSIILVGKARSNSFTERIGKHFDLRPKAWFNRILFVTRREEFAFEEEQAGFKLASKHAFEHYSLVLVNMRNKNIIDKFESVLRGSTNCLNQFKYKKSNSELKLGEL